MGLFSKLKAGLLGSVAAACLATPAQAQFVFGLTPNVLQLIGPKSSGPVIPLTQINGPVTIAGPITVQHGGWSATYAGTPPLNIQASPIPFTAQRAGFDASFNATTYTDTIYIQTNLRTAGPPFSGPPMTADTTNVGLSRTLYTTDTVAGVTNNSDETSPPATCNWQMPGRRQIGATLTVSIACGHIDARSNSEIRGARFTISDVGVAHTASCDATAMADDGLFSGDRIKSDFYSCVLNTSALNAGVLLTLNAKTYPWLGSVASGSVWDTSTITTAQTPSGSVERQFSPRYFIKDAVRSGAALALVCPTAGTYPSGSCPAAGVDATGQWSNTTIDTVHPFATPKGAVDAITNASRGKPFTAMSGCANGCADGTTIYLSQAASSAFTNPAANVPQLVAAMEITSDPGGTGKATFSYGAAWSPKMGIGTSLIPTSAEGTLWVENVNWTRTANVIITGGASNNVEFQFTNSVIDLGSAFSAALCSNCAVRLYANTINNYDGGFGEPGTQETRNLRGNHFASISAATAAFAMWNDVGNEFDGTSGHVVTLGAKRAESGTLIYNNIIHFPSATADTIGFGDNNGGAAYEIAGLALMQNVIEINIGTSNVSIGLSRDCDTGAATGTVKAAVVHYNVVTGTSGTGRPNLLYDSCSNPPGLTSPANVYRPHHLNDFRGNAWGVVVFTKDDWFDYSINLDHTTGPNHIGSWPSMFGANTAGNLQRFCDSNNGCYGGDRNLFYTGRKSINGTNVTADTVANPLWVTDGGVQIGGANGAGYGDYHLQGGSPCKLAVESAMLAHGIYGDARPATNDSCGVNP